MASCAAFCVFPARTLQLATRCPSLWLPRTSLVRRKGKKMIYTAASSQRVSFQSSVSTDIVLREYHMIPFERYMEDEDRIFNALFPDSRRRQKLNHEEWRIFMLPLEFLFISVRPVIDMRITLKEPSKLNISSSRAVSKVLTLEAVRWDLRGLGYEVKPSEFSLGIAGLLFPERISIGPRRLKGEMTLNVDLVISSSIGLIPPSIIESVGKALLSQLLQNMKERVNTRLLQDYKEYALQMQTRLPS